LAVTAAWAADEVAPPVGRPAVTFVPFLDDSPGAAEALPPLPGAAFDPEGPMPWLGDGIPALVELGLERSAAVNIVPRADFALALNKRLGVELAADTSPGPISRVAQVEGVTHVISGSFSKEGKKLSVTVDVRPVGHEVVEVPGVGEVRVPTVDLETLEAHQAELEAVSEELEALGKELDALVKEGDPESEESQARIKEIKESIQEKSKYIGDLTRKILKVESKNFTGEIGDVFKLADDGTKFVLAAVEAGGGSNLIAREPTADLEAFQWFAKGAARYYTGEQISFFLRATDKDANFAEAHLRLAGAYLKEKTYADAKAEYEKARSLADYYPSAPLGLATIVRKEEPDNMEAATYLFNESLAIDPSYAPVFDSQGGMYFASADYEAAREAYERFIGVWPTNKDGYYALGNTLWLIGKDSPQWKTLLRSAIESYEKSLAIDPEFAACHYNLASVYKIFEDVDKAIFHYKRYIELEPKSPKRAEIEETIAEWEAKFGPK
jgi:tetratricopeptide (TPR) repeat protein